jgi:hypothetical protein
MSLYTHVVNEVAGRRSFLQRRMREVAVTRRVGSQGILWDSWDPQRCINDTAPQTSHFHASCKDEHCANCTPRGDRSGENGVKTKQEHQVYHPRGGKCDDGNRNEGGARKTPKRPQQKGELWNIRQANEPYKERISDVPCLLPSSKISQRLGECRM